MFDAGEEIGHFAVDIGKIVGNLDVEYGRLGLFSLLLMLFLCFSWLLSGLSSTVAGLLMTAPSIVGSIAVIVPPGWLIDRTHLDWLLTWLVTETDLLYHVFIFVKYDN